MVNTAIIKCYFHDVVIWDVDRNVSAASSFNQAMSSTNPKTDDRGHRRKSVAAEDRSKKILSISTKLELDVTKK